MKTSLLIGALTALLTGVSIGAQAIFSRRIAAFIGEIPTGLWSNLMSGVAAALFILLALLFRGSGILRIPAQARLFIVISGTIGILVITGVAFSLQRTGVAAGLAAIILGQLLISIVADARGLAGTAPIPLSPQRLLGLLVMAFAVYLLLPKS